MTQSQNQPPATATPTEQDRRFDFQGRFHLELDIYVFGDEAQKQLFFEAVKERVGQDAYMWQVIDDSVALAGCETAREMNLKERE